MDCKRFESLLPNALGDEITATDKEAFEAHLAVCANCRRDFESFTRTLAALRSLPGPQRLTLEGQRLVFSPAPGLAPARSMRKQPPWAFRYAAGLLIAFTAGYGLHALLTVSHLWGRGTTQAPVHSLPRIAEETLQSALATAHSHDPSRSDLAKGLMALASRR